MQTEKLTVNRLGEVKHFSGSKNGKPYSFFKVGFQTNEHGDQWYNFAYNQEPNPLIIGKTYDLEIKPREYQGKTYYDAYFPKRQAGGISPEQWSKLIEKLDAINANVLRVVGLMGPQAPTAAVISYPQEGSDPDAIEEAFANAFPETDEEPPVVSFDDPSLQ